MGMTALVNRLAAHRPACYLVEVPGGQETRWALESALDRLGWWQVTAPGHADVLLMAGALPEALMPATEVLWSQLPGPRVRLGLEAPADVADALAEVRSLLSQADAHWHDGSQRSDEVQRWLGDDEDGHEEHTSHEGHEEHEGHEGHDHGDHDEGGHDHDMGMSPSGIPLAGGAEDRDGLEMDQLVHPWGPLLHHWPGGLELRITLRGDVVAEASSRWWADARPPDVSPGEAWDAVATTLALMGDERSARRARAVRDGHGDHADAEVLRRHITRLRRWQTLPTEAAATLLDLVEDPEASLARDVDAARLIRGQDLSDARLLLAATAPLLRAAPATARAHHDGGGSHG
jgi:hypothetical protein